MRYLSIVYVFDCFDVVEYTNDISLYTLKYITEANKVDTYHVSISI